MATQDASEGQPLASIDRSERSGSIGMVLLVALAIVAAAVAFLFIGRNNAQPYVLGLLSALAVIGVFALFAGAAGILRVAGKEMRLKRDQWQSLFPAQCPWSAEQILDEDFYPKPQK